MVASMTGTTIRIPTVADTVRTYLVRSFAGDGPGGLRSFIWLPIAALLVLAIPRVDSSDNGVFPFGFAFALSAANAVSAAWREHQFGGPRRLLVAAGLTTFVASLALLLILVAASITFGPERGSSAIEALGAMIPTDLIIGGLLVLMFVLVAAFKVGEPARKRSEAEDHARIRAERLARGQTVRP